MDAGPASVVLVVGCLTVGVIAAVTVSTIREQRARRRETFRMIALDLAAVQARPNPTPKQLADEHPPSVGQRRRVVGAAVTPEPAAPTTDQQAVAS